MARPTAHSALPESQSFPLVAKGISQTLLPSWYKCKPPKRKGVKSATAHRKTASILKDTQGIPQSQGSTGYSLYLPGFIPRVISGAAPRKLLSCWKLQGWHPQVVTELFVQPEQLLSSLIDSSPADNRSASPPARQDFRAPPTPQQNTACCCS